MEEQQEPENGIPESFDNEWLAACCQHEYRRLIYRLRNESDAVKHRELWEHFIKSTELVITYRDEAQERLDVIIEEINSSSEGDKPTKSCGDRCECGASCLARQIQLGLLKNDILDRMPGFLWESSSLRHGLFRPTELLQLLSDRIREFLDQPEENQKHD
jgi:hypothetical protein